MPSRGQTSLPLTRGKPKEAQGEVCPLPSSNQPICPSPRGQSNESRGRSLPLLTIAWILMKVHQEVTESGTMRGARKRGEEPWLLEHLETTTRNPAYPHPDAESLPFLS